ncbi:MAG TPA: hypothetical protein VFM18_10705 [Methanosarcina sp.]|nr:hypothetical protein [Methanosarcina sp.]
MELKHFTLEEMIEIAQALKIPHEHLLEQTLPVRDGFVKKGDKVWWRATLGPEHVISDSSTHWNNIKNYPDCYQLNKPKTKTEYFD